MEIPQDPYILLSYINTQLRDNYPDLESLCRSLDIEADELKARLGAAGFQYIAAINQFR